MLKIQKKSFNYQDIFAIRCNGFNKGSFVDIGCSLPNNDSNVSLLLDNGWYGVGFDMDPNVVDSWNEYSFINVYNVNVMESIDLINSVVSKIQGNVDYLNLDLDGYPSQYAVEHLDFRTKRFKCMTIEHDEYRNGSECKKSQRSVILSKGYEIVVQTAAEDWYVDPFLVDKEFYSKLKQLPSDYVMDFSNINVLIDTLEF